MDRKTKRRMGRYVKKHRGKRRKTTGLLAIVPTAFGLRRMVRKLT